MELLDTIIRLLLLLMLYSSMTYNCEADEETLNLQIMSSTQDEGNFQRIEKRSLEHESYDSSEVKVRSKRSYTVKLRNICKSKFCSRNCSKFHNWQMQYFCQKCQKRVCCKTYGPLKFSSCGRG